METVEYAKGRHADIFGDRRHPTVLMWHGAQTDARATMTPLGQRVANRGFQVVVPDWNSHADDGGRADLMRTLQFVGEHNTADAIVLVGWSMGGVAAAGATIHAREVRIAHTVCLAGAFMVADPISGQPLPTDLSEYRDRPPFTLLHGDADDVIPVSVSREFAETLHSNEWPLTIGELRADHGAIAGATYRPAVDRYFPAEDAATLATADEVAARIVDAASRALDLNNG